MPELTYSARAEALVIAEGGSKDLVRQAGELATEAAAEANARVAQLLLILGFVHLPLDKLRRAIADATFRHEHPPERESDVLSWAEEQADLLLGPTLAGGS